MYGRSVSLGGWALQRHEVSAWFLSAEMGERVRGTRVPPWGVESAQRQSERERERPVPLGGRGIQKTPKNRGNGRRLPRGGT